ncbi:2Fe-2S iron-sulfur cluster-binding protein [Streptomyces rubrogriseus]|uniref:2Fe-2S iron-sulfur cluster-binding protein n=1 Tax=Streptomyces rubrogriseus TaxID=194673 RepID=UPI00369612E6
MTDDPHGDPHGDQHGQGTPPGGSRWDPLPQGDYDDGATAFVKLPEGGVDALLASSDSPLAAPGHGYVPPQITVAPATTAGTDPAATGSWAAPSAPSAPVDGAQWQVPDAGQGPAAHQGYGGYPAQQDPYGGAAPYDVNAGQGVPGHDDRFAYQPGPTGQWDFSQAAQAAQASQAEADAAAARQASGQDVTGQWSIPVADGDLPDESGEFTTSSLAEQWGTGAPATLPGGAPAPWATQPAGQPWGEDAPRTGPADEERPAVGGHAYGTTASGHGEGHDADAGHRAGADLSGHGHGHGHDSGADTGHGPDAAVGPQGPVPNAHGPGSTASGHGPGSAAASVHGHDPAVRPDGPRPADGSYAQAPGVDTESAAEGAGAGPGVPAPDGTPTGSGIATDGPRGADAAPEGPAGRSAGPGEEARAGSRPEAADGPVTDRAPTGGRERVPEPAREHGQAPAGEPRPESSAAPQGVPADSPDPTDPVDPADSIDPADPTGQGTDAADAGSDADGPEAATDAAQEPSAPAGPQDEHPLASYVLRVNGADRPVTDAWIGESLLYVLRERLGLAGAKDGCSQGECGACNVQVDGRLVASCLVPSVTAAGSEVRTVEGLATDGQPSDVQRALARRGAVQCGFCVPGMAMTVHNLLEGNPAPTELEARQALCGNLCRCSGYRGVLEAVQEVVAEREAHADADAHAGPDPEEPRIPHQAGPGAGGVNPAAFDAQPPPGAQDAPGPHDRPPYGDHGDHGTHGRDGGHA